MLEKICRFVMEIASKIEICLSVLLENKTKKFRYSAEKNNQNCAKIKWENPQWRLGFIPPCRAAGRREVCSPDTTSSSRCTPTKKA